MGKKVELRYISKLNSDSDLTVNKLTIDINDFGIDDEEWAKIPQFEKDFIMAETLASILDLKFSEVE